MRLRSALITIALLIGASICAAPSQAAAPVRHHQTLRLAPPYLNDQDQTTNVTTTTTPPPVPAPSPVADPLGIGDPFLVCVAWRESRDDPRAVNLSSGAGGLFQFLPSTWSAIGGAGLPQDADVPTQIAMAKALLAQQGRSPWAGGGYSC